MNQTYKYIFLAPAILSTLLSFESCSKDKILETKIDYLKNKSHSITSIDIQDNNDSELNFLKDIMLKDSVQIVLLGEQKHSDGTSFLAKSKLVKYLHENLGFNILAFESGLYDCNKSWEIIKKDKDFENGLKNSLFGLWAYSEEFKPLTDYLQLSLNTNTPIQLTGFDTQLSGLSSKHYLQKDFDTTGILISNSSLKKGFRNIINLLAFDNTRKDSVSNDSLGIVNNVLDSILIMSNEKLAKHVTDSTNIGFWKNVILGMKIQVNYLKNSKKQDLKEPISNERDIQMAENLIWLSQNYFPGKKIIVWSANFHLLRNISSIISPDTSILKMFHKTTTLGDILYKEFNKKIYSIVCTSYETSGGNNFFENIFLPSSIASEGSFEFIMYKTGHSYSFVDLRNIKDFSGIFNTNFTTSIMGHQELKADWTKMTDGIFYIETIYKSYLPK